MSAVRNLAGRELNGRQLRIDSAANAPGEGFRGQQSLRFKGAKVKGEIEEAQRSWVCTFCKGEARKYVHLCTLDFYFADTAKYMIIGTSLFHT